MEFFGYIATLTKLQNQLKRFELAIEPGGVLRAGLSGLRLQCQPVSK